MRLFFIFLFCLSFIVSSCNTEKADTSARDENSIDGKYSALEPVMELEKPLMDEINKLKEHVSISVLSKKSIEKPDNRSNSFVVELYNIGEKKLVKCYGVIRVSTKNGMLIKNYPFKRLSPIEAGEKIGGKCGWKIISETDEDGIFRTSRLEDLNFEWLPHQIVFADGTKMEITGFDASYYE